MKAIQLSALLISSAVIFNSCSNNEGNDTQASGESIITQIDSVSYAIGVNIGQSMKNDELSNVRPELIAAGISAAFGKDSFLITAEQSQQVVQNYMMAKMQAKSAGSIEEGKKFLAENATREGVVTLPSGLQYQIIKEGTGEKPGPEDMVSVHYHGTLVSGKVFDSSVERGQPAQFGVHQVIPGWTEALQLMPVGSKWKLWIPSELAYGERSPSPAIGPNATLIFEVELLAIQK